MITITPFTGILWHTVCNNIAKVLQYYSCVHCMGRLTVQHHITLRAMLLSQRLPIFYLFNSQMKHFSLTFFLNSENEHFLKMFLPEDFPCVWPPHWHGLGFYDSTQQPAGFVLSPHCLLREENSSILVIKWQPLPIAIKLDKSKFSDTAACIIIHLILIDLSVVWSVLRSMLKKRTNCYLTN